MTFANMCIRVFLTFCCLYLCLSYAFIFVWQILVVRWSYSLHWTWHWQRRETPLSPVLVASARTSSLLQRQMHLPVCSKHQIHRKHKYKHAPNTHSQSVQIDIGQAAWDATFSVACCKHSSALNTRCICVYAVTQKIQVQNTSAPKAR